MTGTMSFVVGPGETCAHGLCGPARPSRCRVVLAIAPADGVKGPMLPNDSFLFRLGVSVLRNCHDPQATGVCGTVFGCQSQANVLPAVFDPVDTLQVTITNLEGEEMGRTACVEVVALWEPVTLPAAAPPVDRAARGVPGDVRRAVGTVLRYLVSL